MTVRVGVVGLGFMGHRYVDFLSQMDGVSLAAVFDVREDLLQEIATRSGARAFTEAIALAEAVDAVFICTPEAHHVEAAVTAFELGKAVMIEKPIAHTLEAAWQIADAARATDATAMVSHILRFEPRWAAARRAVAAGDLGDIVSISSRRVGNVLDQAVLGGRTSIPLYYGVHDLDIVRWFADAEATSVSASRRDGVLRQQGYDIADLYQVTLTFANGVLGHAELGWHVPAAAVEAPTSGLTVVGSKGWLRIEQNETGFDYWTENDNRAVHPVFDVAFWSDVHGVKAGALANELRHFVDCVRTGRKPVISLEDGIEALRLSLAMEAAADRGQTVNLADFGVRETAR